MVVYLSLSWEKGVVVEGFTDWRLTCLSLSGGTLPTLPLRKPALRSPESVREMMLGDPPTSAVKHEASSPRMIRLNRFPFPVFEPQDGFTTPTQGVSNPLRACGNQIDNSKLTL